ncbi:MAG: L-arabinose isomerase [Spirochaetales bacterium]|nr:L-arabinose isomerase [Spirochaetales bacterium]
MKVYSNMKIWMVSGSQHLYGEETLIEVKKHTKEIADYLDTQTEISAYIEYKGIVTTQDEITDFCLKANSDKSCGGVILWMHTFSPSKMWINGLKILTKPILHLHTQHNRDLPWDTIDMDFMNLTQSAHGGREHGFINTRLKIDRKVVVGYWKDIEVISQIDSWIRAAAAVNEMKYAKICRFGDNMRNVAVTEGDKVAAQISFGYNVLGFGVSDLAKVVEKVTESEIDQVISEYLLNYKISTELQENGSRHSALRDAAKLEIAIEKFLVKGDFVAFTTTFEDLTGLCQLPGLACQRLMEKGYGFAGEGDWKIAALVRAMKVMGKGKNRGTSFMEDYTYHLDPQNPLVLGAHMLEVCPTIAEDNPVTLEIHHLGIGGKEDPVRMVFDTKPGESVMASIMDMGNRFRLLVNEIETVDHGKNLPKLPVARAVWKPLPDFKTAAQAWILAGGAHHSSYSKDVTTEMLIDFAEMSGIEIVVINKDTKIPPFKNELKWNDLFFTMKGFAGGLS